jgi:phage terminase large subunit-like protein
MAIEENTWREIRPVKISQRKRIDGGVALIDAIAKHQKTDPTSDESVYEKRGLVTA